MALLSHILPDGVIAASIALSGGLSTGQAKKISWLTGGCLLLGATVATFFGSIPALSEAVMPVAAGILIYVSLIHLLPLGLKNKHGFLWLLAGLALFLASHLAVTGSFVHAH